MAVYPKQQVRKSPWRRWSKNRTLKIHVKMSLSILAYFHAMAKVVNIVLKVRLPNWITRLLTSSILIGLSKPCKEGEKLKLRPTGIGVARLKLISKVALRNHHSRILDYLQPFQFGLSSCGLESISQIIQQTLKDNPSFVLFRGDIQNA